YTATASDPDGPLTPQCIPASGSLFPLGTTTVSCTATNRHGNSTSGQFPVTVGAASIAGCQADGKIDGRGSLLGGVFQSALAAGYRDDVCGRIIDGRGDTMVAYDYDALTGSANGLLGASCRTDAFYTSDVPYTQATLNSLDGAPGALGCSPF